MTYNVSSGTLNSTLLLLGHRGTQPARPLLTVPNVTSHPSTASVPITVLLYNGPLLCGFSMAIKGLTFEMYRRPSDLREPQ